MNWFHWRQLPGLVVVLSLPCAALALDPAKSLSQYNCHTWTRQNGLPANGISAIAQTRDGYIWLGTQRGLFQFDGAEFNPVDLSASPGFSSENISSLSSGGRGGLWLGVYGGSFGYHEAGPGLTLFENESWVQPELNVIKILEAGNADVWVGTGNGLGRVAGTNAGESSFYTNLPNLTAICEAPDGRIWLGTAEQGLFYWEDGAIHPFPEPDLMRESVVALTVDSQGWLWVGTPWGVLCFDADYFPLAPVTLETEVKALLTDRSGSVWIGTSGEGVWRYHEGEISRLDQTNGLANDFVTALFEDQEGSVWVGTREGVSQITDVKFPIFSAPEGFVEGGCHGVAASPRGGIWTATSRGLSYFDGQTVTNYRMEAGLSTPYIKRVFEAADGDVYLINANKEIEILSEGTVVARFPQDNWPTALAEDASGVVVAMGGDLFRVNRDGCIPYEYQEETPPPLYWVRNLFGCRDGSLLVASVNGIFRLKDGAVIEHWSPEQGLPDFNVLWVSEDDEGIVWAGLTVGMARIKGDHVRSINRENGLADNSIMAIIPDDRGSLWMLSGRGILSVSRTSLDDFFEGRVGKIECTHYDGLESVKTIDTSEVEYIACKTTGGRIWYPTPQGVAMIDPGKLATNKVPPPIHVRQVRVNGIDVTRNGPASVRPGKGEVEIQYAGLSYISPQKVRYRYKLEGFDEEWVEAGSRRSAYYTNLKPGEYAFLIEACNADGVWNRAGATIAIQLPPHYYQTAWFRACGVICAIALLAGAGIALARHFRNRQRRLEQANEVLESKVRNRTRELAEQRNMLRTLIDNLPDNVFVKDTDSRVLVNNQAHARALGAASPEETVGKSDFDFFPDEYARKYFADEQAVLTSGEPYDGEETSVNRYTGKPRWTRTTKVPLRDESGKIIGLAGINRDITERKEWESRLEALHKQLVETSRQAGMAEVATSVLHNVGNVLNSVNVSAGMIRDRVRASQVSGVARLAGLLGEHDDDLIEFLTRDGRARHVAEYVKSLSGQLAAERSFIESEVEELTTKIDHIKEIVAMQQSYARVSGVVEKQSVPALVEDALRMNLAGLTRHKVRVVQHLEPMPEVPLDKHKVLQILVNLISNAKYAMSASNVNDRVLTLEGSVDADQRLRIAVVDNGVGISRENLTRIFSHGFTTRKTGHGFGLHSGVLAAREMGGNLLVHSDGPGKGARFTLELPTRTEEQNDDAVGGLRTTDESVSSTEIMAVTAES